MPTLEAFLQLPTDEVAALVKASGEKVCVFPINGTRRWFMLEHADAIQNDFFSAYMDLSIQNHIELCAMLFEHGIETILAPVFGRELLRRGDEYTQRVGIEGLIRTATDKNYRAFFERFNVKIRFYGDYRNVLTDTPHEGALQSMDEVVEATKSNSRFRLYFGVFADESSETVARLSGETILRRRTAPGKPVHRLRQIQRIRHAPAIHRRGRPLFLAQPFAIHDGAPAPLHFVRPSLHPPRA